MTEASEFRPLNSSIYSSKSIRRKTVGLTVKDDLLAIAREYGLNLSKLLETSLIQLLEAKNNAQTPNRASFLGTASFTKEGVVRPPGFEPGSPAWEADVLTKLDYGRYAIPVYSIRCIIN